MTASAQFGGWMSSIGGGKAGPFCVVGAGATDELDVALVLGRDGAVVVGTGRGALVVLGGGAVVDGCGGGV